MIVAIIWTLGSVRSLRISFADNGLNHSLLKGLRRNSTGIVAPYWPCYYHNNIALVFTDRVKTSECAMGAKMRRLHGSLQTGRPVSMDVLVPVTSPPVSLSTQ